MKKLNRPTRIALAAAAATVISASSLIATAPVAEAKTGRSTFWYSNFYQCDSAQTSLYWEGWDVVQGCTKAKSSSGSPYYLVAQPRGWW